MTEKLPKVTFGFVNCNRLHYLKSCVESLLYCTEDYPNKEFIIIDNASIEEGTEEFLLEKESQGFIVIRQPKRDPANEFAKALNIIAEKATGDFVCPLQSDMQFILKSGWLRKYVEFYSKHINNIGCMIFDAQRKITNNRRKPYGLFNDTVLHNNDYNFVVDVNRNPILGAADCMFSKKVIDLIKPWDEKNDKHEGGGDSETKMLQKAQQLIQQNNLRLYAVAPMIPPAAAIYTDPRGTNARVRNNRRYGVYFAPKQGFTYYKIHEYGNLVKKFNDEKIPVGLEQIVETIGYPKPVDQHGNWLKNPINPDTATPDDYVELDKNTQVTTQTVPKTQDKELDDWLNS